MSYPCTGCGCCCKHVDQGVKNWELEGLPATNPLHFPFTWDDTGRCEKLGEDNRCTIYETRPLICNIEKVADYLGVDKKKFFERNIKACNMMMDQDGVPEEFRIK